jgi:tRNA(Ile)-lysidine synthase
MFEKFKNYLTEQNLVHRGDKILLAISGGIDSMVMAHLFLRFGSDIGIAHCNFTLRAEDSEQDEELVRKYAEESDIPFYSVRFDTKAYAKKLKLSVQMAARDLRYDWFETIRKENNYSSVAVAHNLNDNIETIIINLTRGTGISGLTGIRPLSGKIIRPLLFATRDNIIEYCNQNHILYREDKSNADTKYTRNKIRHNVIPVLKEINPSLDKTLTETADKLTEVNEILVKYIEMINDAISQERGESIVFNVSLLRNYLQNRTVLYELFKPFGLNNGQLKDLIQITEGVTGGRIFTGTHNIIRNRNEIIISQDTKRKVIAYSIHNINELRKVPVIHSASYKKITQDFEIPSDRLTACIDSEKISFPMTIRNWKAGDIFYPLGMKQSKKLSDYFIDNKYSPHDKENILILESDGMIIWIVGDRIDNRFRISNSTKKALIIKVLNPPGKSICLY